MQGKANCQSVETLSDSDTTATCIGQNLLNIVIVTCGIQQKAGYASYKAQLHLGPK